jgi:DNA-binding protein H-NS
LKLNNNFSRKDYYIAHLIYYPKIPLLIVRSGYPNMRKSDLENMKFEELWSLHEKVTTILADKIVAEKRELERRLARLNGDQQTGERDASKFRPTVTESGQARRKYPKVLPKYRNPLSPFETWSGRGKRPLWLVTAIKSGCKIDDFRIMNSE